MLCQLIFFIKKISIYTLCLVESIVKQEYFCLKTDAMPYLFTNNNRVCYGYDLYLDIR